MSRASNMCYMSAGIQVWLPNPLEASCCDATSKESVIDAPAKCPESGLQAWFRSTLGALTSQFCNNPLWQCNLNSRPSCCDISVRKRNKRPNKRKKRGTKSNRASARSCEDDQDAPLLLGQAERFLEEIMGCLPSDLQIGEAAGNICGELNDLHECVMSIVQAVLCSMICDMLPFAKRYSHYTLKRS